MKYSTSPDSSRCHSPMSFRSDSSLPMPVTYRQDCFGAATKCYKYLRKLLKFQQMDFEFAFWQMVYLFISPQKVYRNFQNRKQTKSQFARDDPAFLVLLTGWLLVTSITFAVLVHLSFLQFIVLFLYVAFVDCIGMGILVATFFWFITNRYMRMDYSQDVEWGYAFDIHLNAFFPPFVILQFLQLFLYNALIRHYLFIGNAFWVIAICYYIYITFLGYANVHILFKTHVILTALPITFVLYILSLIIGFDMTDCCFAYHQVICYYFTR